MSDGVSESEYQDLIELDTVLQDLTDSYGWQALTEFVEKRMEAKRRRILSGDLDIDKDYVRLAGELKGAEEILGVPAEVQALVRMYRSELADLETAEV